MAGDNQFARVLCSQCGVLAFPHSVCRCCVCGKRHPNVPGCHPVECDQCGTTAPAHRSCLCRHCGLTHSKTVGCRRFQSAAAFSRLPTALQETLLNSRSDCEQCLTFTYPHSHCRCHLCGRIHAKIRRCLLQGGTQRWMTLLTDWRERSAITPEGKIKRDIQQ